MPHDPAWPRGGEQSLWGWHGQQCALPWASVSSPGMWGERQCPPPAFENGAHRKDAVCAELAQGQGARKGTREASQG